MCKHKMVHLYSDQMQKIWIVMSRFVKNANENGRESERERNCESQYDMECE